MTLEQNQRTRAPKTVSVLGATGSVGLNTLDLIRRNRTDFKVVALTANSNVDELAKLAVEFDAEIAVTADEGAFDALKAALSATDVEVGAGAQALCEAAARPSDWLMGAIVGAAGLAPTLEAARRGAIIGLANKECLVSAGDFFCKEVEVGGAKVVPVDSEHSAIYQVFDFERAERVEKITLTASGGPFRTKALSELKDVTPEQAVAHPNWSMGAKISSTRQP